MLQLLVSYSVATTKGSLQEHTLKKEQGKIRLLFMMLYTEQVQAGE